MKLDGTFREQLAAELTSRIAEGSLPGPLQRLLGEPSAAMVSGLAAPAGLVALAQNPQVVAFTVIRDAFISPSLLIQGGSIGQPLSENWEAILAPRRARLTSLISAVGRIEVTQHPTRSWVGTGVLVDTTTVVTNRHVAELMANEEAQGWVFSPGIGGQRIGSQIDFLAEEGNAESAEFALDDILAVADADGPDLAFLRVREGSGLPDPVPLGGSVEGQDAVAAIGYTSRESLGSPFLEEIHREIFGEVYDVKRLAPGRVVSADERLIAHDCSTLGGNSGSALVDIENATVAGIHFKGLTSENLAVPAKVVQKELNALP